MHIYKDCTEQKADTVQLTIRKIYTSISWSGLWVQFLCKTTSTWVWVLYTVVYLSTIFSIHWIRTICNN